MGYKKFLREEIVNWLSDHKFIDKIVLMFIAVIVRFYKLLRGSLTIFISGLIGIYLAVWLIEGKMVYEEVIGLIVQTILGPLLFVVICTFFIAFVLSPILLTREHSKKAKRNMFVLFLSLLLLSIMFINQLSVVKKFVGPLILVWVVLFIIASEWTEDDDTPIDHHKP